MGQSKEVIHKHTPFQADRAQRLDYTNKSFNGIGACLREIKKKFNADFLKVKVIDEAESKKSGLIVGQELDVDNQFHFGMWLVQKSLIEDLAEEGELDTAMDILDNNRYKK